MNTRELTRLENLLLRLLREHPASDHQFPQQAAVQETLEHVSTLISVRMDGLLSGVSEE